MLVDAVRLQCRTRQTMTNETDYRGKMRAVFLAAIMVTSIIGGTVAFTGSAAAQLSAPANGNVEYTQDIAFQGQDVDGRFNSNDYTPATDDGAVLRQVDGYDSDDTISSTSFVEQLDVNNSERFDVDTDDLEAGDYIVVDSSNDVDRVRSNTFEVTVQDLSAEFDDDDLPAQVDNFEDSTAELDVSSSRGTYSYNVSAGGDLSDEDLFNIFTLNYVDNTSTNVTPAANFSVGTTNNGATWEATDEGGLKLVNGSSDVTFDDASDYPGFEDGDVVEFSSPYDAAEYASNSGAGNDFNITPFAAVEGNETLQSSGSSNAFSHDGDVVTNSGSAFTLGNNWIVGLYDEDAENYDEKVVLYQAGDVETDVSFAGIDEDSYSFDFDVTDTEASASADAELVEQDVSASFDEGVSQTAAGDITEFTVSLEDTDETWVQIGGEDSDFVDVLYLKADDEDESMTVQVNTRTLGTGASLGQVYDEGDNVDTIESEIHSDRLTNTPSGSIGLYEDDGNDQNFNEYLDSLGIIDNDNENYDEQLTRPLQPTDYEITVAGTDVDNALFDSDASGDANDELASKVLELQQPEIGDIVTHTAPSANADDTSNVSELVEAATEREEIAVEDQLIVQVEATGIYGALVAGPNNGNLNSDFDRLEDGMSASVLHNLVENTDSESINFEVIAEETTGNQEPIEVDLQDSSDSDVFVVLDEENGQFFVVADTSSDNAFANGDAPDEDTTFTAELEYDADNGDNRYEFADTADPAPFDNTKNSKAQEYYNYPYLLQGETLSSSSELDLAPRNIDFDNVNVDDVLEAENTEDSEISGTTNVAPGTEGELRVSSTDASSTFRNGESFTVGDDGEVSGEFDFSGQEVGDQFETSFRIGGSAVDTVDSMIVEEGTLEDDAPEEDDESEDDGESDDGMSDDGESDDSASDDSASDDSASDDSASDDGESDDSSSEETPGFGAIVALVAVLGAALLATRRQN